MAGAHGGKGAFNPCAPPAASHLDASIDCTWLALWYAWNRRPEEQLKNLGNAATLVLEGEHRGTFRSDVASVRYGE